MLLLLSTVCLPSLFAGPPLKIKHNADLNSCCITVDAKTPPLCIKKAMSVIDKYSSTFVTPYDSCNMATIHPSNFKHKTPLVSVIIDGPYNEPAMALLFK